MDLMTSRFFTKDDLRTDSVVWPLPLAWWSRPYEYAWAGTFAETGDTVLDAACGLEHPFKFFLLDRAQVVYACDMEKGITSRDTIYNTLFDTYGANAIEGLPERYMRDINFLQASITAFPYKDKMFDKIFCISVLEHLKDNFNRYKWLPRMNIFKTLVKKDIMFALNEFGRTLKDDGMIVLTFDYPDINLEYFTWAVSSLELCFAQAVHLELTANALHSEFLNLYCFRAVLKKRI